MSVIKPDKTDSIVVLNHSFVLHPDTLIGPSIDVLLKRSVTLFMYHASVEIGANTNAGKFIVQTRPDVGVGVVNEHWITVSEHITVTGTPDSEVPSGSEVIGQSVIEVVSTTGFVESQLLYFQDTDGATPVATTQDLAGAELLSEWCQCAKITATPSINLFDGITNAKDTSDVLINKASRIKTWLNLEAEESFRVIFQHQGAVGANAHVKVLAVTHDSDTPT